MFTRTTPAPAAADTGDLLALLDEATRPGPPIDPTPDNIMQLVDLCRQAAKAIREQRPSPERARFEMGRMLETYGKELQQNSGAG